jgi:hypothetical protein
MKNNWKLIGSYPVERYSCGVVAGQMVRLRKKLTVKDHAGNPAGEVHDPGEIWKVMPGSDERPVVVWLLTPNGRLHTWDDSPSFFDFFEIIS